MLRRKIIAGYSEIHSKHVSAVHGEKVVERFNFKLSGQKRNCLLLKGQITLNNIIFTA